MAFFIYVKHGQNIQQHVFMVVFLLLPFSVFQLKNDGEFNRFAFYIAVPDESKQKNLHFSRFAALAQYVHL